MKIMKSGVALSLLLSSVLLAGCVTNGSIQKSALHSGAITVQKKEVKSPTSAFPPWWKTGLKDLQQAEYHISPVKNSHRYPYQAANRANNLRTHFNAQGIQVTPRIAKEGAAWSWGLRLAGFGRGEAIPSSPLGVLAVSGNRVESLRGPLTEWYVNDRHGLEHGFTLSKAPISNNSDLLPLVVRMRVLSDLQGRIGGDGRTVDFFSTHGKKIISYGGVQAFDAEGKSLPATLKVANNWVTIEVDDRCAQYPVTIDPLLTSPLWTVEGNQEAACLGWSVASAGDVNGDGYDDVIVGAPNYDNGHPDEGRAYVYQGAASGVSVVPAWMAEGDQPYAHFGNTVASAGDVNGDGYDDVIVGAPSYDDGYGNAGRAFVYYGSAAGLSVTPDWTAVSPKKDAYFGASVAAAGDLNHDGFSDVIVGAYICTNGQAGEGCAYVYHGSASGLPDVPDWSAESDQAYAQFGYSVATAGDVNGDGFDDIIIGAPAFHNGQNNEGRAYVYQGSALGLSLFPAWSAESNQAQAGFGASVASAGDVNGDGLDDIIVGAKRYDNGQTWEGWVFVYHGADSGLPAVPTWSAESNQAQAAFGASVASAGDVNGDGFGDILVGAPGYVNGQNGEGAAFVYHGATSGLAAAPAWTAEGNLALAAFGYSVSSGGDINGDGYTDVLVGAPYYENDQNDEGQAYLYHGGPDAEGLLPAPVISYSTDGWNLNLNWTSVPGATGYRITYAPSPFTGPDSIASLDMATATSLSATLWEGAALYVAVQAYNDEGIGDYSNIEQIFITTLPPAEPVMTYEVQDLNLTVTWSAIPGAVGYRFYYAPYPVTDITSIASMDMAKATSLSVTLWEGAALHIAVQAYNAYGNSDFSNIETVFISP